MLTNPVPRQPNYIEVHVNMDPEGFPHLWEHIFSSLSTRDLLLSAALVCKSWCDIIDRERFCPEKKAYYAALFKKLGHIEDFRDDIEALKEAKIERPLYYSVPSLQQDANGQVVAVEPGHFPHDILLHHFPVFCFQQLKKWHSTLKDPKPNFGGISRHSKYR